ncbi:hypothetical protein Rhe02_37630 [Rhizocola hellebori]|uniref:DUF2637 domain-containing protein n=1 Tax=Rhizocola hellebori TaxID=1392758 RepID=A0A8J3VH59_9ACTN|nr:hypothetical protein [Rhizocola hellebori]GIH05696.1 hypothetical protein Rhe02_37630 [Rhizocola hellebori]
MRPMNTDGSDQVLGKAAEHAAWIFYLIAALGSSIGQIWVGVDVAPWPDAMPVWLRAAVVLPFAVVIDLGGVVCSGFADTRQRLGETAYGWRILSAASVSLGVSINIVGHAQVPYLAVVFGGLGVFAYSVWLLHSAARRRDALRAAGKLAETPPAYGLVQWWREPAATRRAKTLALQNGYSIHESLTEARAQLRTETRRAALADHIEADIRSRHAEDPILASIAATTTPVDDVADALMAMIDTTGWARTIAARIQPPHAEQPTDNDNALRAGDSRDGGRPRSPGTAVLRQIPTQQNDYDRWREIWQAMTDDPGVSNQDIAAAHGVSSRTAQRIRDAGTGGLLDSPHTPVARLAALAADNGHPPATP